MIRKSQRDESLEHLLRDSLGTSRPPGPGSCLDAETLAAWADGALAGVQLVAAQEHVADCTVCQTTLAALARTAPPQASAEPWWRRGLSARWLVPVAATATAIAIWVAVPREEFIRPPEQAQTTAREVAAPQTDATAEPPPTAADSTAALARSAQARPVQQPAAELSLEAEQKAASADAIEERRDVQPPLIQQPVRTPRAEAPPNPAALDESRAGQEAAPVPLGRAPTAVPEPAAPARAGRAGALGQAVTATAPQMFSRQIIVASPGTAFRWRIGPAGAVEYSTDSGITWESRPTGVDADLLAGASPSGTVCWVVGRAGTVLLTTDGRQWRRVAFPAAMDLTAVQATDARTATVTASDGRRFRTADGGGTWEGL